MKSALRVSLLSTFCVSRINFNFILPVVFRFIKYVRCVVYLASFLCYWRRKRRWPWNPGSGWVKVIRLRSRQRNVENRQFGALIF